VCAIRYRRGRDRMVVVFTTTCAIGVPITTKVVSSNPAHGEVYSIQHFFLSLSGTCDRSVVFSEYSGFLHQNNWPPWYNWNIVETSHRQTSRCVFITTPFRLNRRSCLLSESGNATFRSYVQTTCISNWLIWKQKICKTFLSSSRHISIIIVTQNSLKKVSWPIFWTKYVTL
jgi:hypothetical protein